MGELIGQRARYDRVLRHAAPFLMHIHGGIAGRSHIDLEPFCRCALVKVVGQEPHPLPPRRGGFSIQPVSPAPPAVQVFILLLDALRLVAHDQVRGGALLRHKGKIQVQVRVAFCVRLAVGSLYVEISRVEQVIRAWLPVAVILRVIEPDGQVGQVCHGAWCEGGQGGEEPGIFRRHVFGL